MSDPTFEDETPESPAIVIYYSYIGEETTLVEYQSYVSGEVIGISSTIITPATGTTETETTTTQLPPTTGTTTTTITITDTPTTTTGPPAISADQTSPVTVTIYSHLPTQTDSGGGGGGGSSLSSSAKAGIGVGVALGGILFIAVGVIFWFQRRKRRLEDALQESPVITETAIAKGPPYEVDATERRVFELPGKGGAVNQAVENERYELDS
ncbi:hypothetical protein BJX65DRAFT_314072 [Aspergillus insuetus]